MSAVDTSVVVPAVLGWHEHHERCRPALVGARVPAQVLLESYAVMTRLPSPHRIDGSVAGALLAGWFGADAVLAAPATLQRQLTARLVEAGVEGGAAYDALVALTARAHGERLVTRDRRALATYAALGVEVELLE